MQVSNTTELLKLKLLASRADDVFKLTLPCTCGPNSPGDIGNMEQETNV